MGARAAVVRGVLRGVPWPAVALLSLAGGAVLGLGAALPDSPVAAYGPLLALGLCAGAAAYAVDEPAAAVVDATPTSLRRRSAQRLLVLLVPAVAGGVGIAASGRAGGAERWPRLLLVLAGVLVVGVTVAAVQRRAGSATPGERASVVVVAAVPVLLGLDPLDRWVSLLPASDGPWGRTAALWAGVLALSLTALWAATRDPAARPL